MTTIKIAICDDEEIMRTTIREYIEELISKYPDMLIHEYTSGEELVEAYKENHSYDILFLDIQMKEMDGVQTALSIKKIQNDILVIFLTSYSGYVKEAFQLKAFQYLLKPVQKKDLIIEFERAVKQYSINHYKYIYKFNHLVTSIDIKDIIYIEVQNHDIMIYTPTERYIKKGKLKEEEEKLKMFHFSRCHQGYLVNMKWIKMIEKDEIVLRNGKRLPISKRLTKDIMTNFTNYIMRYSI